MDAILYDKIGTEADRIIENIQLYGSGFDFTKYAYTCYKLFRGTALPPTIYFDFSDNTNTIDSFVEMFMLSSGTNKITIKGLTIDGKSATACFYTNHGDLVTVEFVDCNIAPSSLEGFFRGNSNLTTIIGEIDFSNATSVYYFFDASVNVKEFRAKQNSISINLPDTARFNRPKSFSDDTLASIANGLNPNVSGNTIALHADMVTRCGTLMGTNDNGTFVIDESGTMSLANFITTVKGWTLA